MADGPVFILKPQWDWLPLKPGEEVVDIAHDPDDPMLLRVTVKTPVPSRVEGLVIHNIGQPNSQGDGQC